MAFVVVQHLSPDFKSLMGELLARHTQMAIEPVKDGMPVLANSVYLLPPGKNMVLRGGKLLLEDQNKGRSLNLPIDIFFGSLAEDAGDRAIAVVLSGTGSDGSRGLRQVHESGGLVIGQSTATAGFDGMPRSAKATGMVDVVTGPAAMPGQILKYAREPESFDRGIDEEEPSPHDESEIASLFRLLRRRFRIDFERYRPTTIERRIERRISMTNSGSLTEYLRRISDDTKELDTLYRDLLVEVTEFFRDPTAFSRLSDEVIPNLLSECQPERPLRIWVPACATGEEAYSIAILIRDWQTRMPKTDRIDVKIFATDVHQESLETASAGVYSSESVVRVPSRLREKYLHRSQDLYHVAPAVRQMVIFAPHDITADPPFTKLDLISCRNALIYFKPEVQRKVISLFHFGLRVGGTLFLGPSETLGEAAAEFNMIDGQWRIFSKTRDVRLDNVRSPSFTQPLRSIVPARKGLVTTPLPTSTNLLIPEIHEVLLREYVPPSLLINQEGELLHCFGAARDLLRQPEGQATLDIMKMVQDDLRTALGAALQRVRSQNEAVVIKAVPIDINGTPQSFRLVAKPYTKSVEHAILVCLEPDAPPPESRQPEASDYTHDDQAAERILTLERELDFSRESLQATVEELETSNEELQSTNEELVASNEELQSTNEELHSVNEELHTVNAEHQHKIAELMELTTDMDNLLKSTEIGTIFLDADLTIRKFTPAIGDAFHILPQDIGRPIEHLASNLDVSHLIDSVREVLETGRSIERQARSRAGRTCLLRIQPYTHSGDIPSGVVLTCVDVSSILAAYEELSRTAETISLTDRDLQEFAYAVSHDLQAPLRHIFNHSRLLRDRFEKVDDVDTVESFAAINSSVARLESMLMGLLRYSRVYSLGRPFTESDLGESLEKAIEALRPLIEEAGAIIEVDSLPSLKVDPDQFTTVFSCLIRNSLQYARDMPVRIRIKCARAGGHWQIEVCDNGIGIAPQHRDRVFVIFERLEFRSVPGEGIGLSLCKRIVQRHGGSIAALDGVDGRGTTIRISLPRHPDEATTDPDALARSRPEVATSDASDGSLR